jgi:hypothetical protein
MCIRNHFGSSVLGSAGATGVDCGTLIFADQSADVLGYTRRAAVRSLHCNRGSGRLLKLTSGWALGLRVGAA